MTANGHVGHWTPATNGAALCDLESALAQIEKPLFAVTKEGEPAFAVGGTFGGETDGLPVSAYVGPLPLANLGDPSFCADHGLKYPYCAGAMANGIASEEVVEAMAHAGLNIQTVGDRGRWKGDPGTAWYTLPPGRARTSEVGLKWLMPSCAVPDGIEQRRTDAHRSF